MMCRLLEVTHESFPVVTVALDHALIEDPGQVAIRADPFHAVLMGNPGSRVRRDVANGEVMSLAIPIRPSRMDLTVLSESGLTDEDLALLAPVPGSRASAPEK